MSLKVEFKYLNGFADSADFDAIAGKTELARSLLYENRANAAGNAFHGWVNLPFDYDKDEYCRIKAAAKKIRGDSEALVVIGIGGSYLGARAAIEFVKSKNYNVFGASPKVFFIGNTLSPVETSEILAYCEDHDFSVNVISKSGTTTEPAIAFRLFRELLVKKYGAEGAAARIYATTDANKGTLHDVACEFGYERFTVPDDVGGRYSVLTAVGLLPIAAAGVDIDALMAGARASLEAYLVPGLDKNDCLRYAAARNILLQKGRSVEMMISYEPDFTMMNEWLKQLFGESEGKDGKGIFPASAIYSTDLHSLGQYVQQGQRLMFETVNVFDTPKADITVGADASNADGLNFLAGSALSKINSSAFMGTVLAHTEGGVPNIIVRGSAMDEFTLGELIYFYEKACAVSGYILGVNPFDQPGVEMYKRNMFALLNKPGYEDAKARLVAKYGNDII
ncbi:MAG: glucose-6-phosphate isomerase [Clostridia bacterium]|nr:glucose-6-phosphate isomerase [Clostridia bacterium]MCR5689127.1 glucose-6-phosphate isomerase [Clostridiales bacterium]